MTAYKIQLFLHVATVVVALGATFAYPFLQAAAERSGTAATRFMLQATQRIEKVLVIPGAILLFLFGLGLIFDDTTGYSDDFPAWLMVAIAWFLVAFVVAVTVQRSNVSAALRTLEGAPDGPLPAAYEPIGKRIQIVGGLLGLSVIGITFLMTYKPGD